MGRKLNYNFTDPNDPEVTADFLLKILVSINEKKINEIMEVTNKQEEHKKITLPA